MRIGAGRRYVSSFVPVCVLAAFVSSLVLMHGIPALRHDWRISPHGDAVGPLIASLSAGWLPTGIGAAQPYPTFYLIGFALWPLYAIGPFGLTLIVIASSIALAAYAAMELVRALDGDATTAVAAAMFATLNPWVYSKYVAGHPLMIFAYAALLALVAETARATPRRWALIVFAALSITQIEFFIIAFVPLLAWLCVQRAYRVVAVLLLVTAPIAYGVVASYAQISATPFNLSWQDGQSLNPVRAVLLDGYVFDYAHAFAPLWPATLAFVLVAASGAVAAARSRRDAVLVGTALAALLLSTGTKGPLAPLYRWAVLRAPEIGVFRELYDLVALLVIAYIVLIARGSGRYRLVGIVLCFAAASYAGAWVHTPPASSFVGANDVPAAPVPARPRERVAFLPAFQPMTLAGRGSGVDPDAYVRDGHALPFNEFFPTYPVDAALGFAAFRGDDRYLQALSVGAVLARPYLHSNYDALKYQWVGSTSVRQHVAIRSHALTAMPQLTLTAVPQLATIGNRPDEAALFFGDVAPHTVRTFAASRASDDARSTWVDARLAIPLHPEWGTAFGGVTTQSGEALAIPRDLAGTLSLLAHVDGLLRDDAGRVVARSSNGLHWWPLAANTQSVRCAGECIVVLAGNVPAGTPEHRPLRGFEPLTIRYVTPWLATAEVPARSRGMLRLNVRFDRSWTAYANWRALAHVRLNTILNGWTIATPRHLDVVFVEWTAAVQCVLEILAFASVLVACAFEVKSFAARRIAARRDPFAIRAGERRKAMR